MRPRRTLRLLALVVATTDAPKVLEPNTTSFRVPKTESYNGMYRIHFRVMKRRIAASEKRQ